MYEHAQIRARKVAGARAKMGAQSWTRTRKDERAKAQMFAFFFSKKLSAHNFARRRIHRIDCDLFLLRSTFVTQPRIARTGAHDQSEGEPRPGELHPQRARSYKEEVLLLSPFIPGPLMAYIYYYAAHCASCPAGCWVDLRLSTVPTHACR